MLCVLSECLAAIRACFLAKQPVWDENPAIAVLLPFACDINSRTRVLSSSLPSLDSG